MSRIAQAFAKGKAFIGFVTAGDPSLDKTAEFVLEMERAGADLVELGVPFSDPIAEGPVIQAANVRALAAGTTTDGIFELVAGLRQQTQIPLVLLTYVNPVYKYGYARFLERCRAVGVDGLIIPDLPFEERQELEPLARQYDVDIIALIAPTSAERIRAIAAPASGFLYIVSSMGVTGVRSAITTDLAAMVNTAREVSAVPTAVGFGVNTPEQARDISRLADGVIVGSAIVKLVAQYGAQAGPYIYEYVKSMKDVLETARVERN